MQRTAPTKPDERSGNSETDSGVRVYFDGTETDKSSPTPEEKSSNLLVELWSPAATLVIATAVAAYQNFLTLHTRATLFGDSRHYLETCCQLVASLRGAMEGVVTASGASNATSLASHLMLDGPVITVPPAILFAIIGKVPTPLDWPWFTATGCLLHGINAMLTCLVARRLTNSRAWALVAGLGWALYPAAIASSERYLTEIPATTLLLAIVLIGSRMIATDPGPTRLLSTAAPGLVLGLLNALLLLLKPALLPAAAGVDLLVAIWMRRSNHRVLSAITVVLGLLIVLLPWGIYTKALTGELHLVPQRVPSYNLAMGCNLEVDGWGALPVPPSTRALERKARSGLLNTVVEVTRDHPVEISNLFLRKISRLWLAPWNDFRVTVLGIPAWLQEWWHCALVAFSITGLVAALAGTMRRAGGVGTFVGSACIVAALSHLLYIPFETIARYGHSSIPYFVIFAAYGLFTAVRMREARLPLLASATIAWLLVASCRFNLTAQVVNITADFRTALLVIFACRFALTVLLLWAACSLCVRLAQTRRSKVLSITFSTVTITVMLGALLAFCVDPQLEKEWSTTLKPGQTVGRTVYMDRTLAADSAPAAVLIDGDSSLRNATVSINGHVLADHPELLMRLRSSDRIAMENARYVVSKVGMSVDEVRNWWAVSFPASWANKSGSNEIKISNSGSTPIKIYGDYTDSWNSPRRLPSIGFFIPTEFFRSAERTEGRIPNFIEAGGTQSQSYRDSAQGKQDLSDDAGLQTGQWRICLMLKKAGKDAANNLVSSTPSLATNKPPIATTAPRALFCKTLTVADFDPMLASQVPGSQLRVNRYVLKHAMRMDAEARVPAEIARARFVRVRVSGMVRAVKGNRVTSIVLKGTACNSSAQTLLTASPPFIKIGEQWSTFEIRELIAPAQFRGGLKSLKIKLFPGDWESVEEYGCDRGCSDALFKDIRIDLEQLDAPSLDGTFEII